MRILIAGDVHGAHWTRHVLATGDKLGIELAIIVGDCWDVAYDYSAHKCKPKFVEGNHEKQLDWFIGLERGVCYPDYITFEIDGSKFGVISRIDEAGHEHLKTRIPWLWDALGPKPDIWMEKRDRDRDFDFTGIDVLLCHDGPKPMTFVDMEDNLETAGSDFLTGVVNKFSPKYVFHGHYHYFHDRMIGDTRVIGLNQQTRGFHGGPGMLIYDTVTKEVEILGR